MNAVNIKLFLWMNLHVKSSQGKLTCVVVLKYMVVDGFERGS